MRRRQTNARRVKYNGIQFRSMLERDMYKLLKKHKIPFAYEQQVFEIDSSFTSPNDYWGRFLNGKGEYKNRKGKKYKSSVYTPDFTPPKGEPLSWIIEIKGRSFPDFSRTLRLFKKYLLRNGLDTVVFVPRSIEDCLKTIEIIKDLEERKSK